MSLNKKEIFQQEITGINEFDPCINQIQSDLVSKTCILLKGELAAGKTTFVQKFCEHYNFDSVSSPTFSLHNVYENDKIQIHHFDLYRLSTADEVETSGLWEAFSSSKGIVFIEWPSRISENDLPLDWSILQIELTKISEQKRLLKLSRLFR